MSAELQQLPAKRQSLGTHCFPVLADIAIEKAGWPIGLQLKEQTASAGKSITTTALQTSALGVIFACALGVDQ